VKKKGAASLKKTACANHSNAPVVQKRVAGQSQAPSSSSEDIDVEWKRSWAHVLLTALPGDASYGVGEVIDREPQLALSLSSALRRHFESLRDLYHKYADVTLPVAALQMQSAPPPMIPGGQHHEQAGGAVRTTAQSAVPEARELKNTDLHKLSENSWLQLCRDARLIGDGDGQIMASEACLIFTGVNTRRHARNVALGSDGDSGSIRGFTFSEFVEGIIHLACRIASSQQLKEALLNSSESAAAAASSAAASALEPPSPDAPPLDETTPPRAAAADPKGAAMLLSAAKVVQHVSSLVEGVLLPRVEREDVRGFRNALRNSAAIADALESHADLIRHVHGRYATRGDEREWVIDADSGAYGLTLPRYTELVWEAGLIGRELSRNSAKSAFVNSLNVGDALAGVTEFGEVLARLAHALTPLSREERVGAPPPPAKPGSKKALAATVPLPPPMLRGTGETVVFTAEAESLLLPKLQAVLTKLTTACGDPDSPRVQQLLARFAPPVPSRQRSRGRTAASASAAAGGAGGGAGWQASASSALGASASVGDVEGGGDGDAEPLVGQAA
jgi:hypothetical protein